MVGERSRGEDGPGVADEEARAKAERRRRGLGLTNFLMHATFWVVLTYFATDYVPPLAIRGTVGLHAPTSVQFLMGYLALSAVCLLLGAAFGNFYKSRIAASRYPWRWYLFPLIVAVVLIPPQGKSTLLSSLIEASCLLAAALLGAAAPPWFRRLPSGAPPGPAASGGAGGPAPAAGPRHPS